MRTILAALALLMFAVTTSAQAPSSTDQASQKQPEPCTVAGRVLTAAEGAPIKSAHVMLLLENAKPRPVVFGATTDNEGRFEIKKVPPGRYRFSASRTGFVGQQYQAKGTSDGAVLSLVPGQQIDDALFRLVRAAVIAGRVVDEAGEPMVNVYVSTLRRPTPDERDDWGKTQKQRQFVHTGGAMTDDRGEYRIFGLKPGEYFIKASESPDPDRMGGDMSSDSDPADYLFLRNMGTQYAPLYYPGVLQITDAQPIPLRAGEEMQADFALHRVKTVDIAGHVIGADGKPATHTFLMLAVQGIDGWGGELSASTDSKGEFIIKGVPPGTYILSAQQHDDNRHEMARQKLEVGESNLDSVVVSFGRGTNISGRVVTEGSGAALDRIGLVLQSESGEDEQPGGFAQVKSDGSFEVTDVSDGSYAINIWGLEKGWFVKAVHFGAADVLQKGLQLERETTSGNLEILISSAGAQLEGAVTDSEEKPVVAAQVRLRPDPETPFNHIRARSTGTDQNGHFSFDSLPPGKYKLFAKLPSPSPEVPAVSSEAQTVTLSERDHQTVQLKLDLPKQQP